MGNESIQYYDLAVIFKQGDLDLRRVVRSNLTMRVGEYYNQLKKFEADSWGALDALNRIADQKADENDLDILSDLMELLEDIGNTKLIQPFDDIVKAGKRGHWAFASDNAGKAIDGCNKLFSRLGSAKKPEGALPAGYATQSLKNALQQIESGEAVRKLRILAVDDSPVMLNTISSILGDDYKVYGMAKPTMVEKFLEQITPELFLLDYEMPEINGFELIPIIRSFDEHKETPIIFLTSMGSMEHVSTALSLGACDYIVKPFKGDNLRGKVAKHLVKNRIYY